MSSNRVFRSCPLELSLFFDIGVGFQFQLVAYALVLQRYPNFSALLSLNSNVNCYWQMNKKLHQLKGPKKKQLQATRLSVEGRGMLKYL